MGSCYVLGSGQAPLLPLRAAWSRGGEDENRSGLRSWERWAHGRCPSTIGKALGWQQRVVTCSRTWRWWGTLDLSGGHNKQSIRRTLGWGRMGWGREKEAVELDRWGRSGRWKTLFSRLSPNSCNIKYGNDLTCLNNIISLLFLNMYHVPGLVRGTIS